MKMPKNAWFYAYKSQIIWNGFMKGNEGEIKISIKIHILTKKKCCLNSYSQNDQQIGEIILNSGLF